MLLVAGAVRATANAAYADGAARRRGSRWGFV